MSLVGYTQDETDILKSITTGRSWVFGGGVVYFTPEFTAYDYLVAEQEMCIQMNLRTATGASLRNLAVMAGVEYDDTDSDEDVRRAYYAPKEGWEVVIKGEEGKSDIVIDLDVGFSKSSGGRSYQIQ